MAKGDHIAVRRLLYFHHGIEIDDRRVVHFTEGHVQETSFDEFVQGATVMCVGYPSQAVRPPDEVAEVASAMVGKRRYNPFFNNCEHFATYCKTGSKESKQLHFIYEIALTKAKKYGDRVSLFTPLSSLLAAGSAAVETALEVGFSVDSLYDVYIELNSSRNETRGIMIKQGGPSLLHHVLNGQNGAFVEIIDKA